MKAYKNIKTKEDFDNMFNKMNLAEIKEEYFDLIKHFNILNTEGTARIFLTPEQFERHFFIKDPSTETRGRKKTILTDEEKEAQLKKQREYALEYYHKHKNKAQEEG